LQYKALWRDKTVILADKWFASSKTCSVCGYEKKDLLLQERSWECPSCGTAHHRDVNAAVNLERFGKNILLERQKLKSVDTRRGKAVENPRRSTGQEAEKSSSDARSSAL
jgi:transposase